MASDFQTEVEEKTAVAVADFIALAMVGSDCRIPFTACADAAQCVNRRRQCSGPGVEQTLACCNANDVCASLFGSETFQCRSRAMVNAFESAEVLECSQP